MKPLDMVMAAKLVSVAMNSATYAGVAEALGVSPSEAHASARRLVTSNLFKAQGRHVPFPRRQALLEFWVHGLKYVFPAEMGGDARGIPTSIGALPLSLEFQDVEGTAPVWPAAHGTRRGPALAPIHPSALKAAADPRAYELLSLLDALRAGRLREQNRATLLLQDRMLSWC